MPPQNTTLVNFEPPVDGQGYYIWKLSNLWQRHMRVALQKVELTHAQYFLLSALNLLENQGKTATQIELASYTEFNIMMTSKVLRALEKKKLVTRVQHPKDTRAKVIKLTTNGKVKLWEAIAAAREVNSRFFAVSQIDNNTLLSQLKLLCQHNIVVGGVEEIPVSE